MHKCLQNIISQWTRIHRHDSAATCACLRACVCVCVCVCVSECVETECAQDIMWIKKSPTFPRTPPRSLSNGWMKELEQMTDNQEKDDACPESKPQNANNNYNYHYNVHNYHYSHNDEQEGEPLIKNVKPPPQRPPEYAEPRMDTHRTVRPTPPKLPTPVAPNELTRIIKADPPCCRVGDVLLTLVVLTVALSDLTFGIIRLAAPMFYLTAFSNFNITATSSGEYYIEDYEISDDSLSGVVKMHEFAYLSTVVSGWGGIESGTVGLLVVLLRALMWYKRKTFNGANYQFLFLVSFIGRTGALMTSLIKARPQWNIFQPDTPIDTYILLGRASLSLLGLLLSLWEYSSSWSWLDV